MYVLSTRSMETNSSWVTRGVYSAVHTAYAAILNHIIGTNVAILDRERTDTGEILYGFNREKVDSITFRIEEMTIDNIGI